MSASIKQRASEFFLSRSNFRICCVINILFSIITFIDYISYFFVAVLFFWGFYLLAHYYIKEHGFKKLCFNKYIAIFLAICSVTVIVRLYTGFISSFINISTLIISAFYLIIFFGMHTEDIKTIKKEIYTVCKAIIIITTVCTIIGIILLALFHNSIWVFGRRLIIFENRFEGIYINPNPHGFACFTALFSCLVIRCSSLIKDTGCKPVSKKLLILCSVLNSLSLLLSDSNSSVLILSSFLIGLCCYKIFGGKELVLGKAIAVRTATLVMCCFVVVFSLLLVRTAVSTAAGAVMSNTPCLTIEGLEPADDVNDLVTEDGKVTFEHINKNIDSGRFKLYKMAGESIINYPLFGAGYGSILYNGFLTYNKLFDYHNGYLTIIASNGLLAFAVFVLFGLKVANRMSSDLFKRTLNLKTDIMPYLFAFICAYCIYSCVEPTMLYYPSYQSCFFWFVFGSAFAVLKALPQKKESK